MHKDGVVVLKNGLNKDVKVNYTLVFPSEEDLRKNVSFNEFEIMAGRACSEAKKIYDNDQSFEPVSIEILAPSNTMAIFLYWTVENKYGAPIQHCTRTVFKDKIFSKTIIEN
jgi:hypothetical protein